ncbi:MAG: chromosome segregation protein SMC [Oscillospiraceae bacterium]|nr:chromosome segregation protein SMC [Oscillospiraceae bacterium]
MAFLYLKALEIEGFKSFPDRTVLSFEEDITAIVGPNGSGKSNISDAIRWVMGEQSTRALRGGKMEDVIFGGTAKRKQTNYAEVSLVLDNTSHIFDMDETEVMVTRRYYRSGESMYYINRRSVRLKDVNELFMDTGLGREGYSIIGQGKIDEILSVKSADRREVFEEAAGISRFRHRKEEAERKLAHTDENLVRINDKIEELEQQVEPLRIQSEKAKKFLVLHEEQRSLEISVWIEQLERIRANGIKLSADYEDAMRRRDQLQKEQDELYAALEDYSEKMRGKDMEMEALREQIAQRQAGVTELESAVAVLKNNIVNNEDNARRIQEELAQQEGREGGLVAQIGQRCDRLAQLEQELAQVETQLEQTRAESQQAAQSAGTLAQELEQLRQRQAVETADAAEAKALLSALAAAAQEVLDRDSVVRREAAELDERLEQARKDSRDARTACSKAEEERDAVRNIINGYTLRLDTRRKKAEQARDRHVKLQMEDNALASRIKMLSEMEKLHEGFSKAVKIVMSEAERGTLHNIHGPVAELVKVPEKYTVAIEIALGSAMQNIVVDREEDGKAVINYLKRRDAGRVTCSPLSSVRPGELREAGQVKGERGFVGIADQLIDFDKKYANVFSNILGRVVIMEDMDCAIACARKFGHKFRIVTLDGQVLNPGGTMTGGSVSRSAGILSRSNELERLGQQSAQLQEQLAAAQRELAEAERESTAANYEMETAQSQLRQWEDDLLKAQALYDHCKSVVHDLERQQEAQQGELELLAIRSGQIEADTKAARERISQLEGAAAALASEEQGKLQGQTEVQARSADIAGRLADLATQQAALMAERQANENSLAELEALRRDVAGDRDQSLALMADFQTKNEAFTREIEEKEQTLAQLRREDEGQNQTIRNLNQEKLALEAERNRTEKASRDKNTDLMNMQQEVSSLDSKRNSAAMEEKLLLDKLWDTYELSHEAAKAQCVELESVPKATRRISELKRSISALGPINHGAIEEFDRVNERYTYLSDQRNDVQKAKEELETIIGNITGEMQTIFAREFKIINDAFGQTFQELFRGGKATLELEDPEDILNCGIEIKVQPPGKALKIITLLSGGEKAFVAIALYFAILKVRPTPFVVMDEIEAALDDNNVVRFADYMRTMSEKTQFIVITHRRGTMEEADVLYGVTMQEQGVSRLLAVNLNDVEKELKLR